MSLNTWFCKALANQATAPPSRSTLMGRATTCKITLIKSCVYVCRVALLLSGSSQPCRLWPARLLCQRGARILERIGQYWLPYPSRALYFLLPLAANPTEYLVLPELLQPKQLHHFQTWPSQGQTHTLQGILRN